jgi:hypothetical protein
MYVLTGVAVLGLAVSRYTTTTARESVEELADARTAELEHGRLAAPTAPTDVHDVSRREFQAGR